jgi:hypothetical protein
VGKFWVRPCYFLLECRWGKLSRERENTGIITIHIYIFFAGDSCTQISVVSVEIVRGGELVGREVLTPVIHTVKRLLPESSLTSSH